MSDRIQVRRGSAEEWRIANPILLPGEIGYERETTDSVTNDFGDGYTYGDPASVAGAVKIGDGVSRWNELPYLLTSLTVALSGAGDVEFSDLRTGDVMRYSNGKWRNYPDTQLVDGGNW